MRPRDLLLQALSAPSSTVASRLSISEQAKSARSSSDRLSAFCISSVARSVMASVYRAYRSPVSLCPSRTKLARVEVHVLNGQVPVRVENLEAALLFLLVRFLVGIELPDDRRA